MKMEPLSTRSQENSNHKENLLLQAFEEQTRLLCSERVKVLFYLGILLVPLFSLLDWIAVPRQLLGLFLIFRLICILVLLVVFGLAYPRIGKLQPGWLGIVVALILGGLISVMTRYLGGYESSYYAGLNMVVLGVALVLPLNTRQSLVTCGLIYMSYIVPIAWWDKISRPDVFIANNFFLLGTISIAVISSYYNHRLRLQDFRSSYHAARSNEQLRTSDQEKTLLLANLGKLISSSLDVQSVAVAILKLIKETIGFPRAACFAVDRSKGMLGRALAVEGDESFRENVQRLRPSLCESSKLNASISQGESIVLGLQALGEDCLPEREILKVLGTDQLVMLPLREKGETSWVLLVDCASGSQGIFEEKLHLLRSLALPASAAMERARLFHSEKKRTSQLLVIHEISRAISSILDFNAVSREFAQLLKRNFGYDHVSIYKADNRNCLLLSALVDARDEVEPIDEISATEDKVLCKAQRSHRAVLNLSPDEEHPLEGNLHPGAKSQLCIPYCYSSRTLGVINIESEKHGAFDEQDITVLETLSDYLAIWVNNARLYGDIARKANALQTLNSIGKAISSELDINNLFELIYRQVGQVLPSEDFFIALYERGADHIEVKFEVTDGKRKQYLSTLSHDGLVAYVMQTQTPFLVKDSFARVYESVTRRSPYRIAQSWLGVPLILGEESLGVIVLQNFRIRHSYDSDDLNFLSTIADQAAVAIANARLFREAQERATRLAVVNEITREASLNLEVDKLFEKIVAQLRRVVSFEKSSIAIYQPETDTFSLLNVYGENLTVGFYKGMEIPARETVMKIVYETKKPYYTRNLDQIISHTSPYLVTQGIQSAVSIPIISEDVCLGTLNLGSRKENGFPEDQIDLLVTIANSLGTALKNARLYSALEQSYTELQNTQEQLIKSEKLRALGEMSAGVAHDFNNILGAILGRAQLMQGQIPDPAILRGLEIIEKAAIDGASTVRRLQDFTRKRTDQAFTQVDLIQVVEDTLSMTRTRWKDSAHVNGIQYSINTQYEPISPVAGDSSELREVFTNVIFNALDAMPNGGKIHIRVWAEDGQVFVATTDTGRGMTEEVRRKVFDPFFSTKGVKGNGLGMSVAYGIINRHKGEIEIESEVGKGSTVRVSLPINLDVVRPDHPTAVMPKRKVGRFLIIDDEAPIRELLAEMLADQGHVVYTAAGGREGLEIFKAQGPDMVITDLGMPEVSGWDVASTVKTTHPDTSVILMTGWGITLDRDKARAKGVDVIVSKPFQISEIQKVVNELLELRC